MAEILAPTTAAANSLDQVIAAGTSLTMLLKPATGAAPLSQLSASVTISSKTSGGDYLPVASLTPGNPSVVLTAVGTFRVSKAASTVAYGVDAS